MFNANFSSIYKIIQCLLIVLVSVLEASLCAGS